MGSTRLVIVLFLAGDGMILILHYLFQGSSQMGDFFDLDKEANLPTWYSSFKFSAAALAAAWCFFQESGTAKPRPKKHPWGWLLIAVLMLGMSVDETAQVHETLIHWVMAGEAGENLRHALGATRETDSMWWGVIFSPILILIGLFAVVFYYSRFRAYPLLGAGLAGALLLLGGSLLLETYEAGVLSSPGFISLEQWRTYRIYFTIEEMAELVASTLLLSTHYAYGRRIGRVRIENDG